MSKKPGIFRLGITLFLITLIVGAALAGVNALTKDTIKENDVKTTITALNEVLPTKKEFVLLKEDRDVYGENIESFYTVKDEGYAVLVKGNGYGGEMKVMVGINSIGEILNIKIVSMNETPGLGTKTNDKKFTDNFVGKTKELTITKNAPNNESEINGITGATISSKAVTMCVNDALKAVENYRSKYILKETSTKKEVPKEATKENSKEKTSEKTNEKTNEKVKPTSENLDPVKDRVVASLAKEGEV